MQAILLLLRLISFAKNSGLPPGSAEKLGFSDEAPRQRAAAPPLRFIGAGSSWRQAANKRRFHHPLCDVAGKGRQWFGDEVRFEKCRS
ncbi:MAG: hypothetical protein IPJ30_20795 [Acidobacteria bacterium]|nr:hypothetical protein [Acidobacteriota bacterium]